MERIAVILNNEGKITSFTEGKYLKVFERKLDWRVVEEVNLKNDEHNGIKELRGYYNQIASGLNDCKIIIVTKAIGIPYSVFYGEDFSVWELEGNPLDHFDNILVKERLHEEELKRLEEEEHVYQIKEGHYLVDLSKLEITKPELSSKKVIIPFMENTKFEILEVHCCHVPPWLVKEEQSGAISMKVKKITNNQFKIYIKKG